MNLTLRDILTVTQIYHLEFLKPDSYSRTLIEIINNLPALDSLEVSSLILSESISSSYTSTKSKITKVYFEKMNSIEEIDFLIKIFPRLTYLKVNLTNKIDYESFFKHILDLISYFLH